MPRLLVTGAGRSGTNWLTEIVKTSNQYHFTASIEDRTFFTRSTLPDSYATKLATENNHFNIDNISRMLDIYTDLDVLFSVRHPIATCIAKIIRGQPSSVGGNGEDWLAPDATVSGAISSIYHAYTLLVVLQALYPTRVYYIKLENLINTDRMRSTINNICNFLDIPFTPDMVVAHRNTENQYHQARYGGEIDAKQADYKQAYQHFIRENPETIEQLVQETKEIVKGLRYE